MLEIILLALILACVCGYCSALQAKVNRANHNIELLHKKLDDLGPVIRGIPYNLPVMISEALREEAERAKR